MTDSSESSSEEDFLFPDTNPNADEFDGPRRKRRKTGRNNKESAALGIFGSESDDDRPGQRWKAKSLRGRGVGFVSSKTDNQEANDLSGEEDGDEDDEQEDRMSGVEATGAGLGWASKKPADGGSGASLGLGFAPSFAQQAYTSSRETMRQKTPPPVPKPSNFGGKKGAPNNSFAAKMMAKMGYVEGHGLGSIGQGMLNPIETKLRPQGAGLGAVKERTQQAKDEAKRQAARQGVVLEDSSEEERKKRQKAREKQKLQRAGGQTSAGPKKVKYRTIADIEAATEGLEVPNVLKSLIDATGKEQKLLTSTSGLMTSNEVVEAEATKIARRAKRDLEAFADAWNVETEKKKYLGLRELQINQEIDSANEEIERTQSVLKELEGLDLEGNGSLDEQWEAAVQVLEMLQRDYIQHLEELNLTEAAISTLKPLFRRKMDEWDPLENPSELVATLQHFQPILRSKKPQGHRKPTTLYESLIVTHWLPKIRSVLTNWNVYDPQPAIALLEAWSPLLPDFVLSQLLNQIVIPALQSGIKSWMPRARKSASFPPPHTWLFPWLPLLPPQSLDMESTTSLPVSLKHRLRAILRSWDLTSPPPQGISDLAPILPTLSSVLTHTLLPRISAHFHEAFEIDPSEQDLAPLTSLMQYTPLLPFSTITRLLTRVFFPKWLSTLHLWLTSDPDYAEIAEWYEWWKTQFPSEMSQGIEFRKEWMRGLVMMNRALDLGEKIHLLPAPVDAHPQPMHEQDLPAPAPQPPVPQPPASFPAAHEPLSFKDQVDDFCQASNLLFLPMRSAHPISGLPLWRITASPSGRGGVVVYLKGDVVWAKHGKEEGGWQPMGLDEKLVFLAEGG